MRRFATRAGSQAGFLSEELAAAERQDPREQQYGGSGLRDGAGKSQIVDGKVRRRVDAEVTGVRRNHAESQALCGTQRCEIERLPRVDDIGILPEKIRQIEVH